MVSPLLDEKTRNLVKEFIFANNFDTLLTAYKVMGGMFLDATLL